MEKMLEKLQTKYIKEEKGNLSIIRKEIPHDDVKKGLDPLVKKLLLEQMNSREDREANSEEIGIESIRNSMGFDNIDLAPNVRVEKKTIAFEDRAVSVRIYHRETDVIKPAIVFFHGGGFIGGSLKTVENPCKYLALQANCVVISVDYRLAPEHPFPAGLMDCYDIVQWTYEHSEELSIDSKYIGVAGDSAGANLATACSMLDAKEKNIIQYQALIYPGVNFSLDTEELYEWSFDHYSMGQDEEIIKMILTQFSSMSDIVPQLYVPEEENAKNPLISPIFSNEMELLPPTSVIIAEFDNLKVEGKVYAEKLAEKGVPTKLIEYKGMDHAFIDKLGIYPQAADCLIEIAKDYKKYRQEV